MVKKIENICNRLDSIPACDRRTNGQIDGQTDRQTSCHGIVRVMHTRRAVKISVTRLLVAVRVFGLLKIVSKDKTASKCTQTYHFGGQK